MRVYKFKAEGRAHVALTIDMTGRNLPQGYVWAWLGEVEPDAAGVGLSAVEIRRRLTTEGFVVWP